MKRGLILLVALAAPSCLRCRAQAKTNLSPEVIYSRNKKSVVTIITLDDKKQGLAQGSGFVVAKNRVVTNYHVVAGSTSAGIVFDDGTIVPVTHVIAASEPKDLVILEVNTGSRSPLTWGDELATKVGETVYAIGSPQGLSASLSSGLISAFREDEGQFLIQITANIAPGSSGGPLFDPQGHVIGITTSKLKDNTFGFAVGAGDIQHLLRTPLVVPDDLADLKPAIPEDQDTQETLDQVRTLYSAEKYTEAASAFDHLPAPSKSTFDGQLLLCRIDGDLPNRDTTACDRAISLNSTNGAAYGVKAYVAFIAHDLATAEKYARSGYALSNDSDSQQLLGLIMYYEGKYSLVAQYISEDTSDSTALTLLQGAARRTGNLDKYRQIDAKLKGISTTPRGWDLFDQGLNFQKDLKFDDALASYKKCEADKDFFDPICTVSAAQIESMSGSVDEAKKEIDAALNRYFASPEVVNQAVFIELAGGDRVKASELHDRLQGMTFARMDFTDCVYYYATDQPRKAEPHCVTQANTASPTDNTSWSNAGYVALDLGQYQTAVSDFGKATNIYVDSKDKHTVSQEIDLMWGLILAEDFSGDKKSAKATYQELQKDYPDYTSVDGLKQLSLIWSSQTLNLISKAARDLR